MLHHTVVCFQVLTALWERPKVNFAIIEPQLIKHLLRELNTNDNDTSNSFPHPYQQSTLVPFDHDHDR